MDRGVCEPGDCPGEHDTTGRAQLGANGYEHAIHHIRHHGEDAHLGSDRAEPA